MLRHYNFPGSRFAAAVNIHTNPAANYQLVNADG